MHNLPDEPGAAVAVHGSISVEHHAGTEVVVRAPGQTMRLTDQDGRDLAACCSELFPSMCCGTGWYRGGPR